MHPIKGLDRTPSKHSSALAWARFLRLEASPMQSMDAINLP
ncbi:hypothetical protein APY03_4459 [Variovorax sp. WDL1]|nr:hypothetical protein APY03_4459 [Variovorax sp. WDL1]